MHIITYLGIPGTLIHHSLMVLLDNFIRNGCTRPAGPHREPMKNPVMPFVMKMSIISDSDSDYPGVVHSEWEVVVAPHVAMVVRGSV